MGNSKAHNWSLVSPLPVVEYVSEHDEYLVHWNGYVMPHVIALNVALADYKARPTPAMIRMMNDRYRKLYEDKVFGDPKWAVFVFDEDRFNPYHYFVRKMSEHFYNSGVLDNMDVKEVFHLFDYRKAVKG